MTSSSDQKQNVCTMIKCPTCQKVTRWQNNPHRPFCSNRCRLLDLGCWAEEEYRVPSQDHVGISDPEESYE